MSTKIVHIECVICHRNYLVLVPTEGYKRWAQGRARIQDALPMLSDNERELLISQICPGCWDNI